jgi:hypothetical protein
MWTEGLGGMVKREHMTDTRHTRTVVAYSDPDSLGKAAPRTA